MRPAAHQTALATVIRNLAAERSPACLLDTQGTFLFVNEAWDRRAVEAGDLAGMGPSLIGTSWLDQLDGDEARRRHAELLERALRLRGARERIVQVGEANTATTAALLSTRLEPVLIHGAEPIAVSVVHTVVRERPIEQVYDVVHGPADRYRDSGGAVVQCSCCRRVLHPGEEARWDLVPELLAPPPPVKHSLCELCGELHYRE